MEDTGVKKNPVLGDCKCDSSQSDSLTDEWANMKSVRLRHHFFSCFRAASLACLSGTSSELEAATIFLLLQRGFAGLLQRDQFRVGGWWLKRRHRFNR